MTPPSEAKAATASVAPPNYSVIELFRLGRQFGMRYRHIGLIIGLGLVATLMEGAALLVLLPVMQILQQGGDVSTFHPEGKIGAIFDRAFAFIGVEPSLGMLLLVFFLLVTIRQAVRYAVTAYLDHAEYLLVRKFRYDTFRELLTASFDFFDQHHTGNIVNDMTVELPAAIRVFLNNVRATTLWISMGSYAIGAIVLSPVMTLITGVVFLMIGLLLRRLMRRQQHYSLEMSRMNSVISSYIVERIRGIRLVRLAGIEARDCAHFDKQLAHQYEVNFAVSRYTALLMNVMEPIILGTTLIILYFGVTVLKVELSELILLLLVVMRLFPVFREIMVTQQIVRAGSGCISAIERLRHDLRNRRDIRGGSTAFAELKTAIRFEGVSFAYRSRDVPVLDNVSLDIPANRMTALIGPSGSGKSTLIDLLPRLRVFDQGQVMFDQTPIEEFDLKSLRHGIAFVPQSPVILDLTILDHILCGNDNATEADAIEAARLAGALEFIQSLPDGFNTVLGESGGGLSGGQRQRIDLARALARNASILILDEPTSNLDPELERRFKDMLQRLREQTSLTIIVIAHRLSTIRDADQIVLLNAGRVESVGDHATLLQNSSWYAEAVADQNAN